ncbi:MAG: MBL fold metallo-hydrolase [Candidatus Thorarchaeota archaeon]|jgi:glyoxylase-like metal-dependent hydrolase (beta-lactamase superfamily II)
MTLTEITTNVYSVNGGFIDEFGFITTYIVIDDDQALVIDPGTAGSPGQLISKALGNLGIDEKEGLVGILCTHGHPDHIGGVPRFALRTKAPVFIHPNDVNLIKTPQDFVETRLKLDRAGRIAMKFEKGPLKVNYKGIEVDRTIDDGDEIGIGSLKLRVIHTAGHSAGHCAFFEPKNRVLFSGDELNNFPNDPRKFYVDLTGNLAAKFTAIDRLEKLRAEYLLPSHDTMHLFENVQLQISEVRDGVRQFQDQILDIISTRGEVDLAQLVHDLHQVSSISLPTVMDALLPTTLQVTLESLQSAGLARHDDADVWSLT